MKVSAIILAMVLIGLFFTFAPISRVVHASGPTVNHQGHTQSFGNSFTISLTVSTVGDTILVGSINRCDPGAQCTGPPTVSTITDTFGDSFGKDVSAGCNVGSTCGSSGSYWADDIWSGAATSSGADTITVTLSQTANDFNGGVASDVTGIVPGAERTATGICTSICSGIVTSTSNNPDALEYAGAVGYIYSGVASLMSAPVSTVCLIGSNVCVAYSTGQVISTNYPFSCTLNCTNMFVDVGAVYGTTNTIITVYTTVPCTFTQLQCWWYPTLFMGLYMSPFIAISTGGKVSPKGSTYLLLGSFAYGSFIEVILGLMNIGLPLMILVVWVLYSFRFQLSSAFSGARDVLPRPGKIRSWKSWGSTVLTAVIGALGLMAMASPVAVAGTTTSTVSIIGWLAPDVTHLTNGIFAILYPFVGIAMFTGGSLGIGKRGDFLVTMTLLGQLIGSVLSMLSVNANSTLAIPFSMLLIPGFALAIWLWEGGVGG